MHENERVPLQKLVSTHCEPHSTVCTRVVHTGGKSTKNMPRRYLRSETNHHRVSRCSTIQFLVVFTRFSCWYCTKCTFQNRNEETKSYFALWLQLAISKKKTIFFFSYLQNMTRIIVCTVNMNNFHQLCI